MTVFENYHRSILFHTTLVKNNGRSMNFHTTIVTYCRSVLFQMTIIFFGFENIVLEAKTIQIRITTTK